MAYPMQQPIPAPALRPGPGCTVDETGYSQPPDRGMPAQGWQPSDGARLLDGNRMPDGSRMPDGGRLPDNFDPGMANPSPGWMGQDNSMGGGTGGMMTPLDSGTIPAPAGEAWASETGSQMPSAMAQGIRMKNPLSVEATHNPADNREAYLASLRSLLMRNVGYFVVATFLMGGDQMITWQGILYSVGSDYLVIYQPDFERYVSCDLYSLKFVQFHNTRSTPYSAASQSAQGRRGV